MHAVPILAKTPLRSGGSGGHGEADPVAPNTEDGHDDPAGRAQNRRVVISFPRG
jgi:flagellar motor protein MotB